jgi:thiaminase
MGFSEEVRAEAGPIWQAIFGHSMPGAVRAGTLPVETFRYCLTQDWHYLGAFGRCVGLAIGKARTTGMLERLAGRVLKPVEKPLHRKLFGLVGLAEADVATAALGTLGEIAAALLPCPWTYHEIGKLLADVRHPVYSEWAAFRLPHQQPLRVPLLGDGQPPGGLARLNSASPFGINADQGPRGPRRVLRPRAGSGPAPSPSSRKV